MLIILVDSRVGSKELAPIIRKYGVECELTELPYADVAMEGCGPHGPITIGCERKTLNDLLCCIDDSRYAAHQRPGMLMMYTKSFLFLEGMWTYGDGNGYEGLLMQGYRRGQSWGPLRVKGGRTPLYSKLYRYLLSVSLSGVIITNSLDINHTAYNLCELWHFFQKPWHQHRSLMETQKLAIPSLNGKPSLVRRWAAELPGIGVEHSLDAERVFKTGTGLALSTQAEWETIPGIGPKTAKKVVREINGE